MKIKLNVTSARRSILEQELTSRGIEISEDADLVLIETQEYTDSILAKKEDSIYPIPISDIVYFESLGHDMYLHTLQDSYRITQRLKALEAILNPGQFLRVSNSVIVACDKIRSIKPALSSKFTLTMKNGDRVDVTRSYYQLFRDRFGL